ncbi:GNAT family N-acetyltransferase, partial [Actinoplanes sp. NPDC051633]|uniref:GNAT family N-acetyltransferase n=1 Tax=Actinoplanes sp. NPDC051633 TaxID=3155670 RepID=UPI0034388A8F
MKIRQVSAAERVDTMFALQAYAFEPTGDPAAMREHYLTRVPFFETCLNLIAEEDGAARACAAAWPMRQNVRGKLLDMSGVASVASDPAYRRRGFVRELMTELLRKGREAGQATSVLWPFRPSFYARFGFVGLPQARRVELDPAGLPGGDLPGEVRFVRMPEAFDEYDAFLRRVHAERHGFAVFDAVRSAEWREQNSWVALATDERQETVGALAYEINGGFGGELRGQHLLTTGPLGRALLLRFLARHVDQVRTVSLTVGPDEVPELWGTDLQVTTTARVEQPDRCAPMARVLDVGGLDGLHVGTGAATVEVVGDTLINGAYGLVSDDGVLRVEKGTDPGARLTAAGFSGLVYGVLDPVDVITRGLGEIDAAAVAPLRSLFPPAMP